MAQFFAGTVSFQNDLAEASMALVLF